MAQTPNASKGDVDVSTAADAVIDTVTTRQQEALETLETAGVAVLSGLTRVQREVAEFVSERLRHDLGTQQELMRCKTLKDLRTLQHRFIRTAMDQYSAEAARLVRLGTETMAKSLDRSH